ncbi:histamine H2 receptor-like [Physella acuta]|uniref:histamine H2 receptor-like n=1 Tax=Physella acuta TaxID=109671 RepID=UPI0027DAF374|nr:histamine H2 receptor-like [Physella acuta]
MTCTTRVLYLVVLITSQVPSLDSSEANSYKNNFSDWRADDELQTDTSVTSQISHTVSDVRIENRTEIVPGFGYIDRLHQTTEKRLDRHLEKETEQATETIIKELDFLGQDDVIAQPRNLSRSSHGINNTGLIPEVETNSIDNTSQLHPTSTTAPPPYRNIRIILKWYTAVVVNPVIALFGIVGNLLNCAVLKRSGFQKPSNIFLFSLAIADICALLGAMDVFKFLVQFPKHLPLGNNFLEYACAEQWQVEVLLRMSSLNVVISNIGLSTSTCLCVVITLERLLAVFFPLKFAIILTPKRAWIISICVSIFWIGYTSMLFKIFVFSYLQLSDVTSCAATYYIHLNTDETALDTVMGWFSSYLSLLIIVTGSAAIFFKIASIQRKRLKMTSSVSASSLRTTQTLLTVCSVFGFTQLIRFRYVMFETVFDDVDVEMMYSMVVVTTSYANSAVNFVIYVTLNRKFRTILLRMSGCKTTGNSSSLVSLTKAN